MASKRSRSLSPIQDNQIPNPSTKLGICQVCGDKARIINYGALSCSSCKTFFRRHGFDTKNIRPCYYKGRCSITIETRKSCTACRFSKCLTIGMSPELIRKEDLYEKYRTINKSRQKAALKKLVPIAQPSLLNLLNADQSSLTTADWRLLSNVIHAFDTYSSVPNTQKAVNLLSIDSEKNQPNVECSLNMLSSIYTSLQSFVNCTADFRIMTTAEQCSLLQRNMHGILAFYCLFVFRESGVFDNKSTENVVLPLYGSDNVRSTRNITIRLEDDATLVKLMLIALTFSSNCFTINDVDNVIKGDLLYGTFRLFGSQNVYAEILWKYMIYRYGLWEAARRFDRMIKVVPDVLRLASDIYDQNKVHRNLLDNVGEKYEHVLKRNGSEHTPLWGKD